MKKEITLEESDLLSLREVAFNATDKEITNEQAIEIWESLPQSLKNEAIHWGISDSVVRDNIYEFLEKQK